MHRAMPAYYFFKTGHLRVPEFAGTYGFHIQSLLPPIVPFLMSISYMVFGFGVWQTKLVSLLSGLLSSVIVFFLAKRTTKETGLASVAALLFILNPVTFIVWQSGRSDATFVLFMVLILYIGHVSSGQTNRQGLGSWAINGLLTGLMVLTYYPFAFVALMVCIVLFLYWVGVRSDLSLSQKTKTAVCFAGGFLCIMAFFIIYISRYPELFRLQILELGVRNLGLKYAHGDFMGYLFAALRNEIVRYKTYALLKMGFLSLLLGLVTLAGLPFVVREKFERRVLWPGFLIWVLFLVFYKKDLYFLDIVIPFYALGAVALYKAVSSRPQPILSGALKMIVCGVLCVGLLRAGAICYTLVYQWSGRDYRAFGRVIQRLIPENASVIGPQVSWFPLVGRVSYLRIYTQGGKHPPEALGDEDFSDSEFLKDISHIITQDRYLQKSAKERLKSYISSHFVLLGEIDMPFRPLPWASQSPFDVDVYVRKESAKIEDFERVGDQR